MKKKIVYYSILTQYYYLGVYKIRNFQLKVFYKCIILRIKMEWLYSHYHLELFEPKYNMYTLEPAGCVWQR